jgi:hypothetical protein
VAARMKQLSIYYSTRRMGQSTCSANFDDCAEFAIATAADTADRGSIWNHHRSRRREWTRNGSSPSVRPVIAPRLKEISTASRQIRGRITPRQDESTRTARQRELLTNNLLSYGAR